LNHRDETIYNLWIEGVFSDFYPLRKRCLIVIREHGDAALAQNFTGIHAFVHPMNGAPCDMNI
jgi:hypothetical protein